MSRKINEVKYLGLVANKFLEWRTHFTHLKKKLNRAISLLSKICHHTSQNLLKPIYFLLFNSHLIYGCQIWGQEQSNEFKKVEKHQEKAIKIIEFLPNDAPITKTMKELKILKLRLYYTSEHSFCERFTDK